MRYVLSDILLGAIVGMLLLGLSKNYDRIGEVGKLLTSKNNNEIGEILDTLNRIEESLDIIKNKIIG